MSHKKFVLLSQARSGTSLMVSILNSHKHILCHGEIFHQLKREAHLKGSWLENNNLSSFSGKDIDYAYSVLNDSVDNKFQCVGFKMWKIQSEDACEEICKDDSVLKIILERDNKLATYSSGLLAKKTGVWNLSSEVKKDLKNTEVTFREKGFLAHIEAQHKAFEFYDNVSKGEVFKLKYHEIDMNKAHDIINFLGQDASDTLEFGKKKLHSSNILNRFEISDHEKILETLKKIDKEEWVSE